MSHCMLAHSQRPSKSPSTRCACTPDHPLDSCPLSPSKALTTPNNKAVTLKNSIQQFLHTTAVALTSEQLLHSACLAGLHLHHMLIISQLTGDDPVQHVAQRVQPVVPAPPHRHGRIGNEEARKDEPH
eukprot:GHUV01005951.1.p2 GENE.GHUV01005951.1~~GHUV01005951.1.p2  ORF type:complete len:128 (-),score=16.41 GHUV01005951.1:22-405(-)